MNKYGLLAQEHWQKHAHSRYQALENPEEFFTELGEAAAGQVEMIAAPMERAVPQDLPYLERVAQLRAVRKQAEEVVLAELVYSVEPEAADVYEELDQILGDLPSASMIEDDLRQLSDQVEKTAEDEGWTEVIWGVDEEAKRDQLLALLPLVTMPPGDPMGTTLSETEATERILALAPFWDHNEHALKRLP